MKTKNSLPNGFRTAVVLALICGMAAIGMAQEPGPLAQNPAYINIDQAFDFSEIKPAVNVHLPKFLLNSMVSEFDGGPDDPFAEMGVNIADIVDDIQLIRFVVFEAKDPQTKEIAKSGLQKLRESMSSKWMPIVNVPDDNVTIFAMGNETGNRLAGLAMLVADNSDVVIGNIIGDIQLGKIIGIASQFALKAGGDPKAKEALEKLLGGIQPPPPPPAPPAAQEDSEAD
jgi:Ca2+/Na+ antiporter